MQRTPELAALELKHWDRRYALLKCLGRTADSGWIILMRVYADEPRGRSSVTSILGGLHVPYTTGLRYLWLLEQNGFIFYERRGDDLRRRHIKLTPWAEARIDEILKRDNQLDSIPAKRLHQTMSVLSSQLNELCRLVSRKTD